MRTDPQIAKIVQPFELDTPDTREPERRRDPRWAYAVTQLVAFHDEFQQPTRDMLQAVGCNDISLGGISFFLPHPPKHEHCTLILGRPPALIVVRAARRPFPRVDDSALQWKIGCEFVEKLDGFPAVKV